jgi:hypothetical protein
LELRQRWRSLKLHVWRAVRQVLVLKSYAEWSAGGAFAFRLALTKFTACRVADSPGAHVFRNFRPRSMCAPGAFRALRKIRGMRFHGNLLGRIFPEFYGEFLELSDELHRGGKVHSDASLSRFFSEGEKLAAPIP